MRFFEIILLLSEFILIGFLLISQRKNTPQRRGLLWIPLLLIMLHALIEGMRWQLAPAYLIGAVLALNSLLKFRLNKVSRLSIAVLGILLLALSTSAAYLVPVFELPVPSGKYRVGTRHMHLIDHSREEDITLNPHDKRELMVKVWYPTQTVSGEKEPYLSPWDRIGTTRSYGVPEFFPSHLSIINSHTMVAPKMAEGDFPVLIFSHGYESPSNIYYATLTKIVSQGYIVAHISHTYENSVTEFPDGRVLFNADSFAVATNLNEKMGRVISEWKESMKQAQNSQDSIAAVRQLMHDYSASDIVRRWSADISFVIDQLFEMKEKPDHFLHGKMKLQALGALGHSNGGAAAAQASLFDGRIKAAANWDGSQFGDAIDTVFHKPFMMLSHHPNLGEHNFNEQVFQRKGPAVFYDATIEGTGHVNFMDIPFWIRLNEITFAGEIDMARGISIINQATLAFFDRHLKNQSVSLTALENEIPELSITLYQGGKLANKG